MNLSLQKPFLEVKVIWKDDDMFEMSVSAFNGRFYGSTEVYEQSKPLSAFAKSLIDYPKSSEVLFYEAGEKDSYAYFSMKYYPVGVNGIAGVEVHLEANVCTEYREEEKDKLKLEIIMEPAAIDRFQKELLQLAKKEEGIATLYGQI
ncbi:hypothetical protein [Pedobacter sp. KBW06]|uniref:hypothetical protein n=1 Tax=Pedobacter sp. KBW06 TaxID=2153359 RepID=UPI0018F3BD89|nr:hypothetical protein [Pedobacter sp. KBW06]